MVCEVASSKLKRSRREGIDFGKRLVGPFEGELEQRPEVKE